MFQLFRAISTTELFFRQLPGIGAAMLIATLFFHFGSFALESLAFLATWFVIDAVAQLLHRLWKLPSRILRQSR